MATTKTKRRKPKPYQQIVQLPPLPDDQLEGLRNSIGVAGVKVPIIVDENKQIIDGWHRKTIADELDYDCPEIVEEGLTDEDKRTLARALNLARRQLNREQKRTVIADQLTETPERSNRWIAKQLGVTHPTVSSVRTELEATGKINQLDEVIGENGKRYQRSDETYRPSHKPIKPSSRTKAEKAKRLSASTLIHGNCRDELKNIRTNSVNLAFFDPPYPEIRKRSDDYPRIKEEDWFDLMKDVVRECKRVVKPSGSCVIILQPNYEKLGNMRLWLFDFVSWAGREWNLVQDCWWWATDAMPLAGTQRQHGLMRQSIKMCVWLGNPDCYRDQEAVLWTPAKKTLADVSSARFQGDDRLRYSPSGRTIRQARLARAYQERGGATPYNLLPISTGASSSGREGHPAATPYDLASWWCRYTLPEKGTLIDPFCGSGTSLVAGLDNGARKVIGIDRVNKYLKTAKKWIGS
ncbi:DNA modification methylase [Rubripirellula sp.]|nr:DNA modification methylase [Rubripirellula sp.]